MVEARIPKWMTITRRVFRPGPKRNRGVVCGFLAVTAAFFGLQPSVALGSVVFNGDFSTGDISQYRNWQTQYMTGQIFNKGLAPHFTSGPTVEPGPYCRFPVPAGGSRDELIPGVVGLAGDDWWVSWWVYLGDHVNLSSSRGWQAIGQFHQTPAARISTGPPPFRIAIRAVRRPVWELEGGPNVYPQQSVLGPIARKGVWTHMLLHIRFSRDPAVGFVSWWANGMRYIRRWHPRNGTIYRGDTGTTPKIGYHRAPAGQPSASVRVAAYTIATTLAEANRPR